MSREALESHRPSYCENSQLRVSVGTVSVTLIPVVLGLPAMVSSVPPLMILVPAALPFGVEISPPIIGLAAVIALVVDRSVQPRLGLFDCVLALLSVIGVHQGRRYK